MKVDDIYSIKNKYRVIYADPPWSYNVCLKKYSYTAEHHYSTMKLSELKQLPISRIKTDDAIIFMWATFPTLPDALDLMKAWGFIYKTAAFVWVKKNKKRHDTNFWGMGQYTRANAEICLVGISKKTKPLTMIKSHKVHQIVESPVRRHSAKPPEIRNLIEELVGKDISRIELFARESAEGWDCWGNEAPDS